MKPTGVLAMADCRRRDGSTSSDDGCEFGRWWVSQADEDGWWWLKIEEKEGLRMAFAARIRPTTDQGKAGDGRGGRR